MIALECRGKSEVQSEVTIDRNVGYSKDMSLETWKRYSCGGKRGKRQDEIMEREQWRQQEAYIQVQRFVTNVVLIFLI